MNEIGEKLKEARKAKGYTLDDLQQKTKIQKRYLIAVEEGDLEVLPGNFYARAFIKQYADSVGLNGEELVKDHVDAMPEKQNADYTKSVQKTQTRSKAKDSGFMATLRDSFPTLLIVLLVIAIIFAIYLAMTTGNNSEEGSFINEDDSVSVIEVDDNEEETGETADESASEEEQPEEEEDEETTDSEEEAEEGQSVAEADSTDTSTTYTVSGTHPSEQQVTLTSDGGDSWVSIEVDGQTAEQGMIADGESLTAEFTDEAAEIYIIIGNAAVTNVELNGEEIPYNSSETEAVRQVVTLEFE